MNIEAFSTKKGMKIAERFLLAHSALMAIDESTTIKITNSVKNKKRFKVTNFSKI